MKVLKQTNKAPEGMDTKAWNVIKKTLNKNLQNYQEVLYSSWYMSTKKKGLFHIVICHNNPQGGSFCKVEEAAMSK